MVPIHSNSASTSCSSTRRELPTSDIEKSPGIVMVRHDDWCFGSHFRTCCLRNKPTILLGYSFGVGNEAEKDSVLGRSNGKSVVLIKYSGLVANLIPLSLRSSLKS